MYEATIAYKDNEFVMRATHAQDIMYQRWKDTGEFYDLNTLTRIEELGHAGTYIDVGANLGNHSVFFGNFCMCSQLVAVEMVEETANVLRHNLTTNLTIPHKIHTCAVGASEDTGSHAAINKANVGATRLQPEHAAAVPVRISTLDELLVDTEDIALMKLDIEGAELSALAGAIGTLQRQRPVLVCEALDEIALRDLDAFLAAQNYTRVLSTNKTNHVWSSK